MTFLSCRSQPEIEKSLGHEIFSRDNRFHQWQANLRILDVKEIKTVPYVALSHPFVERLIGTVRREYLDRTLFWTTTDPETKLFDFQHYYNGHRKRMPGWTGARRNRALTQVAHLQVSGHIDGSSTVADSIKTPVAA